MHYHKQVSDEQLDWLMQTVEQGRKLDKPWRKKWDLLVSALYELKILRKSQKTKTI